MRRALWFSASVLAVTLFVGAGEGRAQADKKAPKEVASFGALRSATPEEARSQAEAWLKGVGKTDDATRASFDAIWKSERTLLEKVTDTLVLGDAKAQTLLTEARNTELAPPTEVPALLKDSKQPTFYRANLALAYAKALSTRRVYEEALDALNSVKAEQVVDPSTYLFNKAVAEHALMKGPQASTTILRLLDDVSDAPERYKMVASLMVFDILQWKDKDLGEIARKMDNIERRLDLTRGGPKTQKLQREVVLRLEEMIKEKENQNSGNCNCNGGGCPSGGEKPGGQSGKNPNNTTNPSAPQDDSYGGNGSGPGNVDPKKLKEMTEGWGKLPEKDRAKAMIELTRDMPPRYRQVIQKYFEELSKQTDGSK